MARRFGQENRLAIHRRTAEWLKRLRLVASRPIVRNLEDALSARAPETALDMARA